MNKATDFQTFYTILSPVVYRSQPQHITLTASSSAFLMRVKDDESPSKARYDQKAKVQCIPTDEKVWDSRIATSPPFPCN